MDTFIQMIRFDDRCGSFLLGLAISLHLICLRICEWSLPWNFWRLTNKKQQWQQHRIKVTSNAWFYSSNDKWKKKTQVGLLRCRALSHSESIIFFSSSCFCCRQPSTEVQRIFEWHFKWNVHTHTRQQRENSPIPFQFPAKSEIFHSNRNWLCYLYIHAVHSSKAKLSTLF